QDEFKVCKPSQLQLIRDAVHTNHRLIGVIYSPESGDEPPEEGATGCCAIVKNVRLGKTGGKIVKVQGAVRFRVKEYYEHERSYPIAGVKYYRDRAENKKMLIRLGAEISVF